MTRLHGTSPVSMRSQAVAIRTPESANRRAVLANRCSRSRTDRTSAEDGDEIVAAAHAIVRESIPFLDRDRALDGEVAAAVKLVSDGALLGVLPRWRVQSSGPAA